MRLLARTGVAALVAAAALAPLANAGAQEPAPRPRPEERAERDARRRAEERMTERRREATVRAQALGRAFGFAAAPDRAVLGVMIGEGGARGVRVEEVTGGSPAERAGIREGEYLTAVGDVPLRLDEADADDPVMRDAVTRRLTRALDRLDAGDEVTLRVAGADGAERTVRVTTVRADSLQPERAATATGAWRMDDDRATLGLSLAPSGTARDTLGAFVAAVVPGGPAERAGVYEGHRVAAIDGVDLRVDAADVEDRAVAASRSARLERALRDVEAGAEVTLRVWDGDSYRDVRVKSGKASEVYEGRPFMERQLFPGGAVWTLPRSGTIEVLPGGTRLRVAPAPAAPRAPGARGARAITIAPRAQAAPRAVRVAPGARVVRVAPRAAVRARMVAPRGEARVLRGGARRIY